MAWWKRRNGQSTPQKSPPRIAAPSNDPLEPRTQQIARELIESAHSHEKSLLSAAFWSDKLMDWSMRDQAFKTQLFRFVDVFPVLRSNEHIHEHLEQYLSQPGVKLPPGLGVGLRAGAMAQGLLTKTVTNQIESMGNKFIAGVDAASAVPTLRKRWKNDLAFSVDLLGEACISDAEAEAYRARYLDLISTLPDEVGDWPANETLDRDHLGEIPRVNVSVKISSLTATTDPIDFDSCIDASIRALEPILTLAAKRGVFVNFDMEQHELKDLTLTLFEKCAERFDTKLGIALQAYLRSADDDAQRLIDWSRAAKRQVTVRLVKGAYWDYETIHAELMDWPSPVWAKKHETDACFERVAKLLIDATPRKADEPGIKLALGSHNARSIGAALAHLESRNLPENAIELQMLYGMADPLKRACVDRGLRVREYVPIGQTVPGMAYLVRRLLENTSNESWLRAGFGKDANLDDLVADPAMHGAGGMGYQPMTDKPHGLVARATTAAADPPFASEPLRDFADAKLRDQFGSAISDASVPTVEIIDNASIVDGIVKTAVGAFADWRDTPAAERAAMLNRAADLMHDRRDALAGVIIKENGKNWRNADADVCEAIDFCRFYAREAPKLFQSERLDRLVGELNEQWHEPRGVGVVISPWNFPIAISCGMTVASLVCGNPTILKPAEQTPGIAKLLVDLLHEAGIPRDVLQFVPGRGETVGQALVRHPDVSLIAFTGSKEVGQIIMRDAVNHPPRHALAKHVVCETGGKNAIIVDASADLDEAVLGVRDSAFGFAGQKCSACSRAIVHDAVYDLFIERLVESTRALTISDPIEPGTDVGPVIDDDAKRKIEHYIEVGKGEATLALGMDVPVGLSERLGRPFVGPHIFTDVSPDAAIARDEIFGPVLAVMRVKDFADALRLANMSDYKLTGGVFTRTPAHLERARREFRVGNLYINRGITGALVGRQPFGGFGMSGFGTKAGGRDYLLQFVHPRICTENTLRRGFAPDQAAGE